MADDLAPIPDEYRTVVRAPRLAPRRSSHLRVRVDLTLRLRGEPLSMAPIKIAGYVPTSYEWVRNAPGTADTVTISLDAEDMPFDLRVIEHGGGIVEAWLYEHDRPEVCFSGAPGYFAGIIDKIERDPFAPSVMIEARDFTALLLEREMTADELNAFQAESFASLEAIVRRLLLLKAGTEAWEIQSLTTSARLPLEAIGYVEPTRIEIKQAVLRGDKQVTEKVDGKTTVIEGVDEAGNAKTVAKTRKKTAKAYRMSYRVPTPGEILASRVQFLAGLVTAEKKSNVWDAITNICARFGVVPEVDVGFEGRGRITLVDAGELQTSDSFRPFTRGDRAWRKLTVGEDVAVLRESLELAANERRPDFVVVSSTDQESGQTYRACWPPGMDQERPKQKGDKPVNGLFQTIEGITNTQHLQRLAAKAFAALAHNQFSLTVGTAVPWSSGGSPNDPDLLDVAFSAALEIEFAGFDKLVARPELIIQRRIGIDRQTAQRIADAGERIGALSLLFQIVEVQHSWGGGSDPSYSCTMTCRQFLGTPSLPIVGDVPRLPDSLRRTA